MKKIVSIITMLCLTFMISAPALAVSSDSPSTNVISSISEALEVVEYDKSLWGFETVDFSNIYIGDAIYTYNYVDSAFEESNIIYPIFSDDNLIALSISHDGAYQQIVTALVDEINYINPEQLALVYDAENCYLYDGIDFHQIAQSQEIASDRDILLVDSIMLDTDDIALSDLVPVVNLDYTTPLDRAQTYFSCAVDYVSQPLNSDLCWAACIACISNYVRGTPFTATMIADETCGEGYLGAVSPDVLPRMMYNEYSLNYSLEYSVPSDLVILKNIQKDYPVLALLNGNSSKKHMCVVYGINLVSGYITIMDPIFGFTTVYTKNNKYTYSDPTRDRTWTVYGGLCRYWSA